MGRRIKASTDPMTKPPEQPVIVQNLNNPNPDWDKDRAMGMVQAGYSIERVAQLSGFHPNFLKANAKKLGVWQ